MKKLLLAFVLTLCAALAACTPSTPGEPGDDKDYKVMVVECEGLTVGSQNPQTVKEGGNAVFSVEVDPSYAVLSVSAGEYDRNTGRLTVADVSSDVRVEFTLEKLDYDTTKKYTFYFNGGAEDESSVGSLKSVYAGTEITVEAKDGSRVFLGWSFGAQYEYGGELASSERSYTFRLSPDMADADGDVMIYANYSSAVAYNYDLNGGEVNKNSSNYTADDYYDVSLSGDILTVTLKSDYFESASAASLFWDDGVFLRDGYILKEYNTHPDGTGESYSLGSKFHINRLESAPTLYCIWAEQTPAAYFETVDFEYAMPSGTNAEKAPHWVKSGLMITAYGGNDATVVIPETIDGKYVTAIAAGAFENKDIETLVMGRRILKIEDGAFVGCDSLTTVYYPDGIYSITDGWLDGASYTSLKNLYVNATIAPRYTHTMEGAFAYKLMKLLATEEQNRVIVIGGSSVYQGLSTAYLEALLRDYTVINLGTTRTTNGLIYLEAVSKYTHSGDVVLMSPENSSYMMGENTLYYKTLRDIEGMYNLFRDIDISNYENVFGAFADFNQSYRYGLAPRTYEQIVEYDQITTGGDCIRADREAYRSQCTKGYTDSYTVTMNNMVKSALESDWRDENDNNWCDFTDSRFADAMNREFSKIRATGATVYFAFAPVDESALADTAKSAEALVAYDALILSTYSSANGIIGESISYVFHHEYFYDCAFHLNDYGRTLRTYRLYCDLADALGIEDIKGIFDEGKQFEGCLFESSDDATPKYEISIEKN